MLMSEQSHVSLRCPVCLGRDVDVVLHHDGEAYYCIKCSFTGREDEVRGMYADLRGKFRWLRRRVTLEDYRRL